MIVKNVLTSNKNSSWSSIKYHDYHSSIVQLSFLVIGIMVILIFLYASFINDFKACWSLHEMESFALVFHVLISSRCLDSFLVFLLPCSTYYVKHHL